MNLNIIYISLIGACFFFRCSDIAKEGKSVTNELITQLWFNSSAYGIDEPIFWEFEKDGNLELTTGRSETISYKWKINDDDNLSVSDISEKIRIDFLSEDSLILYQGDRKLKLLPDKYFAQVVRDKYPIGVLDSGIWASDDLFRAVFGLDYYSKYYFLKNKVVHDKFVNANNSYYTPMYKNIILKNNILFVGLQGIRDFLMTVNYLDETHLSVKLWQEGKFKTIVFDKKYNTTFLPSTTQIEGTWIVDPNSLPSQKEEVMAITPIPKKIVFKDDMYTFYFEGNFYEKGGFKIGVDNELIALENEKTPHRHFIRLLSLTENNMILKLRQKYFEYNEIIKYNKVKF